MSRVCAKPAPGCSNHTDYINLHSVPHSACLEAHLCFCQEGSTRKHSLGLKSRDPVQRTATAGCARCMCLHTRVPLKLSCEYFQGVRGNISYFSGEVTHKLFLTHAGTGLVLLVFAPNTLCSLSSDGALRSKHAPHHLLSTVQMKTVWNTGPASLLLTHSPKYPIA